MGAPNPDDLHFSSRVGRFSWNPATSETRWSDGMFRLYGFEPGEVVPTRELAISHKHPEDRERYVELVQMIATTPGDFALWHRIVDTAGTTRYVVATGTAHADDAGVVVRVDGYTVDVTEPHRFVADAGVRTSVERFRESAAVIEQAKGVLMAARGVSAEEAFEILRSTSIGGNVKLRAVADAVVEHGADAMAEDGI
ncbi:PAS fold-containing protein [Paraoerskovia marina]|uniref:histidine kinase n=1 Tax=Paraoerskovia marina TaxID=545619 RepID=A0A1H1NBF2_9CELL|nr:PAS and ANTAR domain-containing protein [Paraoerskovia marina]SDR96283.1 PAS fold-containing protein [Paraoerskovia marina]